ncbi:MAG: hypothetical protein VW667_02620, partial [Candidatus Neomarinimicrobiota bacterium]
FHNWHTISFELGNSFGGIRRNLTRGGPVAKSPTWHQYNIAYRTDRRKNINGFIRYRNRDAADGEYDKSIRTGMNLRPNSQWEIEFDVFANREFDTDQYVATIVDPIAINTYGSRYLFTDISTNSKGLTFEANYIKSPKLSFQFFLQPELSNYHYDGLKEFLNPGQYDFMYYDDNQINQIDDSTIEIDPDANGPAPSFLLSSDYIRGFNFLSLRSNFILKWEYRPGSSLFLVWQQQRDNFEVTDNDLNLNDGFEKLIDSQSVNTFMVKFAYWLSS